MRNIIIMDKTPFNVKKVLSFYFLIILIGFQSCDEFLEIESPKSKVASSIVFNNDITATSAVTGMYHDMLDLKNFASGSYQSLVSLGGLSADELDDYLDEFDFVDFEQNILAPENSNINFLWEYGYKTIYQSNSIIEGLRNSNGLTPTVKDQLMGEALFIRAFCNFYLINLFGDIPLITTTDYRVNSVASRRPVTEVYNQILIDLEESQQLLGEEYVTIERIRPNKSTAIALLARVYLYLEDWSNSEAQSTIIIENTAVYSLTDLSEVFLANSGEAIWQIAPVAPNYNTHEGFTFVDFNLQNYVLTNQIVNAFEPSDNRLTSWIGSFDTGSEIVYYPYKYKQYQLEVPVTEYSMVLRLAEQYLIRAEARAQQDNLPGAIADVDMIRARAGLSLIQDTNPGITKDDLLLAIEHERQVELFTEWGHRWLDLKRTGRASAVLSPIKAGWNPEDVLYPIPQSEFNKNPQLGDQNPGY